MHPKVINKTAIILTAALWLIIWGLWCIFPGLTAPNCIALSTIAVGVVILSGNMPFPSRTSQIIFATIAAMLFTGVILNAWYFTTYLGGTPRDPVLINPDASMWWKEALFRLNQFDGEPAHFSHGLYGCVLAAVLAIFGITVGTALIWSATLILAALFMTAILTFKLSRNNISTFVAVIATASVCYWLSMGSLILKDAFTILAFLIAGYGFVCYKTKFLGLSALAAVMLFFSRPSYILMLVVGAFVVGFRRGNKLWALSSAAICLSVWILSLFLIVANFYQVISTDPSTKVLFDAPNQMAFYNIVGDYSQLSFFRKILLLPFSAAVQFLIPFPWNFDRDIPFGLTQFWCHIAYPWYLFGFAAVGFLVSHWKDRFSLTYRLAFWALVCWLVPCFIFGGTISRYGLPFVALFAPAVASFLIKEHSSRIFRVCLVVYCLAMAVILIIAHHIQISALP